MAEVLFARNPAPLVRTVPEWRYLEGRAWDKIVAGEVDEAGSRSRKNRYYQEWPYDIHRQIAHWAKEDFLGKRGLQGPALKAHEDENRYRLGSPRHFFEDVVRPILRFSDLFETLGISKYQPSTIGEWQDSIGRLVAAKINFDNWTSATDMPSTVLDGLAEEFRWAVSNEGPLIQEFIDDSPGIQLTANSLLGWCWLNVLRDHWGIITYKLCKAECGHEVPSLSLPTKRFRRGRKITFCGNACRAVLSRQAKQNEIAALKERIAELEGGQHRAPRF